MRLARVHGQVTLGKRVPELKPGALLICEAMDAPGAADPMNFRVRQTPMPESLVVFDHMGAGHGDLIAFTEGGEATQPFRPDKMPIDAYCAAIIDEIHVEGRRSKVESRKTNGSETFDVRPSTLD